MGSSRNENAVTRMARPPSLILWRVAPLGDHGVVDRHAEASGRWHRGRKPIIYASTTPELAVLEALAHLDAPVKPHWLIRVRLSSPSIVPVAALPPHWPRARPVTRRIGEAWLGRGRAQVMLVPSVLSMESSNALIASARLRPRQLRCDKIRRFRFDPRLLDGIR